MDTVSLSNSASSQQSLAPKTAAIHPGGALAAPRLHTRSATPTSIADLLRGPCSTLAQAVAQRDAEQLRRLLCEQADPAATAGYNAAHLAAAAGHAAALPLLQTTGEDMYAATPAGDTPLLLAARHGHAEAVRLLAKSADLYHANKNGDSALTLAAAAGHTTIVQRLLVKGANVGHVNNKLDSALSMASRAGHLDVILALLASGACVRHANLAKETALTLAHASGASVTVALLNAKGATTLPSPECVALVKALDEMEARNEGVPEAYQTQIVRFTMGEETDQPAGDGMSMLMIAAEGGLVDQLRLLLRHGADIARVDNEGYTALMHAAKFAERESIGILLAASARLDCRARHGVTALHLSTLYSFSGNDYAATVALLLDKGADIDCRANGGLTPLHIAASKGALKVVRLLLNRGASLCASDDGTTALAYAASQGRTEVVKYLLDRGMSPAQTNHKGDNALDAAVENKHKGTVALLRERGVKPARH